MPSQFLGTSGKSFFKLSQELKAMRQLLNADHSVDVKIEIPSETSFFQTEDIFW